MRFEFQELTFRPRPLLAHMLNFDRLRSSRRNQVRLAVAFALAATLAACQTSTPLSPASEAILAARPAEPPPVVTTTGSSSSIPVVVNDVPITSYDITQRIRLNTLAGGKRDRKSVIEELIDETLEGIEAARHHVVISDAQVEAAYAQVARQVKLTPATLNKALSGQGIAPDTLKKRLRAQMIWQQLVQGRASAQSTVNNKDINAEILGQGDPAKMTLTEYTLQQIVFVVPSGASAAAYTQRRREAEAFRIRFAGCDKSLEQAKVLRGVVVKDIGRRDSSELSGPQGDLIKKTPAGKTAPPDQIDGGIELIAVCSTRDVQSSAAARAEVANSLFLKQAADLGKDYLKELRDKAIIEYR